MEKKDTNDLRQELMEAGDIDSYLRENQESFATAPVAGLLMEIYEQKNLSKAALARGAGMSEVYLHQVFAGRRNPSRDRLLCLCIGLSAGVEEIQKLLRQAGFAQLDPRITRDALILYGLSRGQSLPQINGALLVQGDKAL